MQGFQYLLQSIDSSTVVWAQLAESWISLIAGVIEKTAPFPCQGLSRRPERCRVIAETKHWATLTDVWQYPRLAKQNPACDSLAVFSLCFGCVYHLSVTSSLHLLTFPSSTRFPFLLLFLLLLLLSLTLTSSDCRLSLHLYLLVNT